MPRVTSCTTLRGSSRGKSSGHRRESGMALFASMLIFLVIATLAIAMFRSFGVQEKISGNMLEKQRSQLAATAAVKYAEWWIKNHIEVDIPLASVIATCANPEVVDGSDIANLRVCNQPLANPMSPPWAYRIEYKPEQMPIQQGGGINTDAQMGAVGDANYSQKAAFHIHYMGEVSGSQYFKITAAGYGSNPATVSVVQSVFFTGTNTTNLGN